MSVTATFSLSEGERQEVASILGIRIEKHVPIAPSWFVDRNWWHGHSWQQQR